MSTKEERDRERMDKNLGVGTGALRSVNKQQQATGTAGGAAGVPGGTVGQSRGIRQQRTATSNRTGGVSSSAQTSVHYRPVEKIRPKVKEEFDLKAKRKLFYIN